jgi:hypothetical protein
MRHNVKEQSPKQNSLADQKLAEAKRLVDAKN